MTDRRDLFVAHSVTTAVALAVLLAWLVVAALASAADTTVPRYLTSLGPAGSVAVFAFSPLIHQQLEYLVSNLLVLVLVGPLVEARLGQRRTFAFVVVAAYAVSTLTYAVGVPAVGLSGVTHALVGRELAPRLFALPESVLRRPVGTVTVGLVAAYQIIGLAGIGSLPAHAAGLLFGLCVGAAVTARLLDPDWLVGRAAGVAAWAGRRGSE